MSHTEINDYQILRYLQGQSSPEEVDQIRIWLTQSEENRKSFLTLKSVWLVYKANYQADQGNLEKSLISYRKRIQQVNRKKMMATLLKYLIAFLIFSGLSWLIFRKTVYHD